jgi:hypothetical protein
LSFLISIFTGTLLTGPWGIVTVTVPVIETSPFVEVALDTWRSETTCLCMLVPSGLTIVNLARNCTLPAWAPVDELVVLLVMFEDVVLDEPVDVALAPVVAEVALLLDDVLLLAEPPTVAEAPPVVALLPDDVLLLPLEVELLDEPPTVAEAPPVDVELSLGPPVIVWPCVEVPVELPPVEPELVLLPLDADVLEPALVELLPAVLLVLLLPEVLPVELLVVELLVVPAELLVMPDSSRPFMYHDPDWTQATLPLESICRLDIGPFMTFICPPPVMELLPAVMLGLLVVLLDPPVTALDDPPVTLPVLLVWLELLVPLEPVLELVLLLLPNEVFPLVLLLAIWPAAKLANGEANTNEKTRTAATTATTATFTPRWRVLCPSSMCDTPIHVIYDVRKATRLKSHRQGVRSFSTRG